MSELAEPNKPVESIFDQKILKEQDVTFKNQIIQEIEDHIKAIQASDDPKFASDHPQVKALVDALKGSITTIESAWTLAEI